MRNLKLLLMVLVAFALAGCNLPSRMAPVPVAANPALPQVLTNASGTATPTPFLPLPLTPTVLPTDPVSGEPLPNPHTRGASKSTPVAEMPQTKTWEDYPGPTEPSELDIPAPAELISQPPGQVNILLLGSDQRPYEGGMRTDTMLLLTINKDKEIVSLTSFPRDLYVYIPGWTMQRLNTAFQHGGWEMMQQTFEYNFGVVPDHYVLTNFWSFVDLVDSLGGLDVEVAQTMGDHRNGYGQYWVYAGMNHMDGETALWYVRARYQSDDFARTRRQQEVITALFKRFMNFDIVTKAPDLYNIYKDNVETDLSLAYMLPYVPLALKLSDGNNIHHYFISRDEIIPYKTWGGAQVLLPQYDLISAIMRQALNAQ